MAESLWISLSSWSANSFAFIAAAARPAFAAALTFSTGNEATSASFWPHEPCIAMFPSEVYFRDILTETTKNIKRKNIESMDYLGADLNLSALHVDHLLSSFMSEGKKLICFL